MPILSCLFMYIFDGAFMHLFDVVFVHMSGAEFMDTLDVVFMHICDACGEFRIWGRVTRVLLVHMCTHRYARLC